MTLAGTPPAAVETVPFDRLPAQRKVRAFGVEYGHVRPEGGGDLYITAHGWPRREELLPANWYADDWFARQGERLAGATGSVYHVATRPAGGRSTDLVVKFSRVAQEISITVATSFPDHVPPEVLANARFNSPMEEFGLLMDLRREALRPGRPRLLAQRPLAIFAPPETFDLWQLGRSRSRLHPHLRLLEEDQGSAGKAIEFDIKRIYVVLYGWIKGSDAEVCLQSGLIGKDELCALTARVNHELETCGFRVLDNKPKHFILRKRRDGRAMRDRAGRLVYGLVDFELLQRTPEGQRAFKIRQSRRYRDVRLRPPGVAPIPSHLQPVTIFGVPYLYGGVPDGGRVWVLGSDPDLFEFFLPERWRRTPRVKLSPNNEVYRTRTRDNIHIVYRRSRVGSRPRIDPLDERARRIREHGFNSPFEEVALAERLRSMGIPTTWPRAVCRTGHPTTSAGYLRDERRFGDHAHLATPDDPPEPVLSPDHDYYTLWDYFPGEGFDAGETADDAPEVVDLARAREAGILSEEAYQQVRTATNRRLAAVGFAEEALDDSELSVCLDAAGRPRRDPEGLVAVRFCLDALTAHDCGLLDETAYRRLVGRLEAGLRAADCELIDLSGQHLLLSSDPDGRLTTTDEGEIAATLCSFDLIRGIYRPIR